MTYGKSGAEKCIVIMERLIIQQFIEWKKKPSRKPLIVNGARQVGKTWLLREFARTQYQKEAYLVCRKNELAKQLFTQDSISNVSCGDFVRSPL
jgi:hypothetical protein